MREIRLYGHLGKKFGRVLNMDVKSPAEALRAMRANFPDFESYMRKFADASFEVRVGKEAVGKEDLHIESKDATIRITPVVAGSGAKAKIVLGLILIVVGAVIWNPYLISMGAGLLVGGAAQLLMAPPRRQSGENDTNKPSYNFNGPVNTTAQGNVVPICYGQMLVGSQVVSAGLTVEQIFIPHETTVVGEFIKRIFKTSPWDTSNG